MLGKLFVLVVIIAIVYLIFFKPKSLSKKSPKEPKIAEDDMVECETCGTYVSVHEALIKDAKYYCSQECLQA